MNNFFIENENNLEYWNTGSSNFFLLNFIENSVYEKMLKIESVFDSFIKDNMFGVLVVENIEGINILSCKEEFTIDNNKIIVGDFYSKARKRTINEFGFVVLLKKEDLMKIKCDDSWLDDFVFHYIALSLGLFKKSFLKDTFYLSANLLLSRLRDSNKETIINHSRLLITRWTKKKFGVKNDDFESFDFFNFVKNKDKNIEKFITGLNFAINNINEKNNDISLPIDYKLLYQLADEFQTKAFFADDFINAFKKLNGMEDEDSGEKHIIH